MKKLLIFITIVSPLLSVAQINDLERMRIDHENENTQRLERVSIYSKGNNVPIIQNKDLVTIYLKDVINGKPHFLKTDNIGARATTGADKIGIDGSLGLDLDGEGVSIAIWDGGVVRSSHNELIGRITPSDGSPNLNFHATHVAGTILSKGLNATSRGMAINASAKTFDFNNDDAEMLQNAKPGQDGIILSNHSYGSVSGWDDGVWYGDDNISEQEDWKFGFYTLGAALWDDIAYNSPYYTIVKSAGNDRGDSGDGTHPSDGPFDIISTSGTAKNIITIGAVNKLTQYSNPLDVVMSSFSGWGPTDDGRIKPDFVAAGVGLLSTLETADDAYGNLSGTSMSAPNATGTFALLQQLHKKLSGGSFMKSSLLKGLVAHTAHEAGTKPGPDYAFGWGLINGVGAADILIKENGLDTKIEEIRLLDGESYILNLTPKLDTKVKATICWTDPAGTVPTISLDPENLILVNDLDLRISNTSEINEPWILNPAAPSAAASKGDNFRDNIEVVEFVASSSDYQLTINHKNNLTNGNQDVFLILTYEDASSATQSQYWIGDDGDFSLASNWSIETGGNLGGQSPSVETSLIFDNNSFTDVSTEVELGIISNTVIKDFIYLSSKPITFNIGSNDLIINGKMSLNENIQFTGTGNVVFASNSSQSIGTGNSLKDVNVRFNNEMGQWKINGEFHVNQLNIEAGILDFTESTIQVNTLNINTSNLKQVIFDKADLTITNSATFVSENLIFSDSGTVYNLEGQDVILLGQDFESEADVYVTESAAISGFSSLNKINIDGSILLESTINIEELDASYGSFLTLADMIEVGINNISINGTSTDPLTINANVNSTIVIDGHRKICLENLAINNVTLKDGGATVSVGTNSTIINSSGWVEKSCNATIFADFEFVYNCVDSRVEFLNLSTGDFEEAEWDFSGLSQSSEMDPNFIFPSTGTFEVMLTVSDANGSNSYIRNVLIEENDIEKVDIVLAEDRLFCLTSGNSFQWYRNEELIDGAVERTYIHNEVEGEYYIVLYGDNCNKTSNSIEIQVTGVEDMLNNEDFIIYPNPVSNRLFLNGDIQISNLQPIVVYDLNGKAITKYEEYDSILGLDVSSLSPGIYQLSMESNKQKLIAVKFVVE